MMSDLCMRGRIQHPPAVTSGRSGVDSMRHISSCWTLEAVLILDETSFFCRIGVIILASHSERRLGD